MERKYWPFPSLKPEAEWTDFDREYVDFMQQAYDEGFQPCEAPCVTIEAASPAGRNIILAYRGPNSGWEPFLAEAKQSIRLGPVYGCIEPTSLRILPPFQAVAHFALEWLRGRELATILEEYKFTKPRIGTSWLEWIRN